MVSTGAKVLLDGTRLLLGSPLASPSMVTLDITCPCLSSFDSFCVYTVVVEPCVPMMCFQYAHMHDKSLLYNRHLVIGPRTNMLPSEWVNIPKRVVSQPTLKGACLYRIGPCFAAFVTTVCFDKLFKTG